MDALTSKNDLAGRIQKHLDDHEDLGPFTTMDFMLLREAVIALRAHETTTVIAAGPCKHEQTTGWGNTNGEHYASCNVCGAVVYDNRPAVEPSADGYGCTGCRSTPCICDQLAVKATGCQHDVPRLRDHGWHHCPSCGEYIGDHRGISNGGQHCTDNDCRCQGYPVKRAEIRT